MSEAEMQREMPQIAPRALSQAPGTSLSKNERQELIAKFREKAVNEHILAYEGKIPPQNHFQTIADLKAWWDLLSDGQKQDPQFFRYESNERKHIEKELENATAQKNAEKQADKDLADMAAARESAREKREAEARKAVEEALNNPNSTKGTESITANPALNRSSVNENQGEIANQSGPIALETHPFSKHVITQAPTEADNSSDLDNEDYDDDVKTDIHTESPFFIEQKIIHDGRHVISEAKDQFGNLYTIKEAKDGNEVDTEAAVLNCLRNHPEFVQIIRVENNQIIYKREAGTISFTSLVKNEKLEKEARLDIAQQFMHAHIKLAHLGYAQFDISPDSILLIPDKDQISGYRVVLCDFDLAKKTEDLDQNSDGRTLGITHSLSMTSFEEANRRGIVKETHIPPDITAKLGYTSKTIIQHASQTILEILTGKRLVAGDQSIWSHVPTEVGQWLNKSLSTDEKTRYQDMTSWALDFRANKLMDSETMCAISILSRFNLATEEDLISAAQTLSGSGCSQLIPFISEYSNLCSQESVRSELRKAAKKLTTQNPDSTAALEHILWTIKTSSDTDVIGDSIGQLAYQKNITDESIELLLEFFEDNREFQYNSDSKWTLEDAARYAIDLFINVNRLSEKQLLKIIEKKAISDRTIINNLLEHESAKVKTSYLQFLLDTSRYPEKLFESQIINETFLNNLSSNEQEWVDTRKKFCEYFLKKHELLNEKSLPIITKLSARLANELSSKRDILSENLYSFLLNQKNFLLLDKDEQKMAIEAFIIYQSSKNEVSSDPDQIFEKLLELMSNILEEVKNAEKRQEEILGYVPKKNIKEFYCLQHFNSLNAIISTLGKNLDHYVLALDSTDHEYNQRIGRFLLANKLFNFATDDLRLFQNFQKQFLDCLFFKFGFDYFSRELKPDTIFKFCNSKIISLDEAIKFASIGLKWRNNSNEKLGYDELPKKEIINLNRSNSKLYDFIEKHAKGSIAAEFLRILGTNTKLYRTAERSLEAFCETNDLNALELFLSINNIIPVKELEWVLEVIFKKSSIDALIIFKKVTGISWEEIADSGIRRAKVEMETSGNFQRTGTFFWRGKKFDFNNYDISFLTRIFKEVSFEVEISNYVRFNQRKLALLLKELKANTSGKSELIDAIEDLQRISAVARK